MYDITILASKADFGARPLTELSIMSARPGARQRRFRHSRAASVPQVQPNPL